MIILIDNYDSFTYNLVHYLGELGAETVVHRNDQITRRRGRWSRGRRRSCCRPARARPTRRASASISIKAAAGEVPLLGVCLGHQAIGQAFGGKVMRAPALMHGKLSRDPPQRRRRVRGPAERRFPATRYHSLIVDRATLPDGLSITAETADGVIMGMQHASLPVHGVQFHPESIASEHGHELLAQLPRASPRAGATHEAEAVMSDFKPLIAKAADGRALSARRPSRRSTS